MHQPKTGSMVILDPFPVQSHCRVN